MSDLFEAIRVILEQELDPSTLNHYSILGIEGDASVDAIKASLRQSASRWNASNSKVPPLLAQQVAGLLKQSQAVLLDPLKRQQYDESLQRSVDGKVPSFATAMAVKTPDHSKPGVETRRKTRKLYPAGDPLAPFDPTQWDAEDSRYSYGSIEERWHQLESIVLVGFEQPSDVQESRSGFGVSTATTPSNVPSSNSPLSSAARVELLKRKRQRNQAMTFGAILIAALLFLGFAAFQLYRNRSQQALADATNGDTKKMAASPAKNNTAGGLKIATAPPVRSNLPSLPAGGEPSQPSAVDPNMPSPFGDDMASAPMAPEMPKPEEPKPMTPAPTEPSTSPPAPETPKPVEPAMTSPATPDKPMSETPEMIAQSKKDWIASMKEGREALEKADFPKFQSAMEKATALSTPGDWTDKQKRLDQFGQLYEIAFKAMKEARGKMRGSDSLTYGKNQISIVEVREDVLIVRIAGKNERHAWNKLPMGVALAMADLSLSDQEPIDLAARGVYLAMSPNKNELTEKKMKEFFEKSLGKGEIRKDLLQALTDKYE